MTQAIAANILNNLQEVPAKDCGMDCSCDFEKIFDETLTIGDMKEALLENIEAFADFKEILEQVSSEVNVENSLDLTLARDINEMITELRGVAEKANVELEAELNSEQSQEENEETDEETDEEAAAVIISETTPFQQILSLNTSEKTTEIAQKASVEIVKPQGKTEENSEENSEEIETHSDDGMMSELNIESVEVQAEISGDGGNSLMNNQSPQEQAVKLMIHNDVETFEIKMPNQSLQTASKSVSVTPDKIIEQVAKQMESMQGNSKVNIVLNPESLGKVSVQLINTKDGLSAQFTVATQEARELLMKGLDGLKETLTSHGVGVDNVSVKISDTQKNEYDADWTEQDGSRGGNKEQRQSRKEEKEKGLFEKMMAQQNEN